MGTGTGHVTAVPPAVKPWASEASRRHSALCTRPASLGSAAWHHLGADLGADLKAHRTPGVEHDGVPDSAYRPAYVWGGGGTSGAGAISGGGGGWHKALVVGSVSLWRRLLASRP